MFNINSNLVSIMKEFGMSNAEELADAVDIEIEDAKAYMKYKSIPDAIKIEICDYFDVPLDKLFRYSQIYSGVATTEYPHKHHSNIDEESYLRYGNVINATLKESLRHKIKGLEIANDPNLTHDEIEEEVNKIFDCLTNDILLDLMVSIKDFHLTKNGSLVDLKEHVISYYDLI